MSEHATQNEPMQVTCESFHRTFHRIREEMARVVVGQDRAVEHLLVSVFSGGHALLTGMPGLGRTLIVQTLADILELSYRRIQFTPDLLPSDIVGKRSAPDHGRTHVCQYCADYLMSTWPPTFSIFSLILSASSFETASLIALGALSTKSLASFRPRYCEAHR